MKKNIFKKIIILFYLIIFLVNIIMPSFVLADNQTLKLELIKQTVSSQKVGIQIKATTTGITRSALGYDKITFFVKDSSGNFIGPATGTSYDLSRAPQNGNYNAPDDSSNIFTSDTILSEGSSYTVTATVNHFASQYADPEPVITQTLTITTDQPDPFPIPNSNPVIYNFSNSNQILLTEGKSNIAVNESTNIIASVPDGKSGITITFSVLPANSFDKKTCVTTTGGMCPAVPFSSATNGTFAISAIDSTLPKAQYANALPINIVVGNPNTPPVKTQTDYYPLAPLPGVGENCTADSTSKKVCIKISSQQKCTTDSTTGKQTCVPCGPNDKDCIPGSAFGTYLNAMIKIFIGLCAVLAMIMIIIGGIQYMTSELISGKEAGKEQITHAILGLLLALGAYAILNTINPSLLNVGLGNMGSVSIPIDPNIANSAIIKNSGSCTPVTDPNSLCTVEKLKAYNSFDDSDLNNMSELCQAESKGKVNAVSQTDICTPSGTPFSFGLWQINLVVNGKALTDAAKSYKKNCTDIFTLSDGSPVVNGNYIVNKNGVFDHYNCAIAKGRQDDYNWCRDYLFNGYVNVEIAKNLPYSAWAGDQKICPDIFKK